MIWGSVGFGSSNGLAKAHRKKSISTTKEWRVTMKAFQVMLGACISEGYSNQEDPGIPSYNF